MIRAKRNLILPIFRFRDKNEDLGSLTVSLLKPTAKFSGKEEDFTFFREKPFEGVYFLSSTGYSYLAQAHKPGGIGLKYEAGFGQGVYYLTPGELFYDRLYLHYGLHKNGELVGTFLRNTSMLEYLIDVKQEVSVIVQIFLFWLSLRAWMGEKGWSFARFFR